MTVPLILASASPARRAVLLAAGISPTVIVSDVDEDAVLAAASAASGHELSPADAVLLLARAKAEDVASRETAALVLGCDSMLEFDGEALGKPGDAATATARWRAMRGRTGVLHTGHWLIDGRGDAGQHTGQTASTTVHFADLADAEIDAYVATGEPLHVAGAFTVDGIGGPFVERIEGDHHNVVGVSLPVLRHLLKAFGVRIQDLWVPNS
ncbi:nucleoside triphosphate pyrophosphatase [Demequina sp.]|uniref:Maf family protein n=1 Tax=Demequina sp. TaxID=2050685 RepID=UPI0025BC4703|nr:nucleoside triphosphate pyrophosphatase [Demequina sp.]